MNKKRRKVEDQKGLSTSREYTSWKGMMHRCYAKNDRCFHLYGARGILVCPRWHSFLLFFEDMGERPNGMTLDRIDTNGGYSKENCRWATARQQGLNRRNNRILVMGEESKPLAEWATEYGHNPSRICARLKMGWSVEKAIKTPMNGTERQYYGFGRSQTARQWADEFKYPCQVILDRMRHGWSIERAVTTPVGNYRGNRPQWWKTRYGYRIGDEGHENYNTEQKEQPKDE